MSEDRPSTEETEIDAAKQREIVRERYAAAAEGASGCGSGSSSCCGSGSDDGAPARDTVSRTGATVDQTDATADQTDDNADQTAVQSSRAMGYSEDDVDAVAPGANLGLGCGNPTAIANLSTGEDVLDLGSGGGFDCFLAAREVGDGGRVIGVDMTPEMVEKARGNVAKNDADNVEFRLGEIENLPLADQSIDVILSNCVVNLSPAKQRVFREAHRVLRPGGRLAITDVVRTADLPASVEMDPDSIAGCVAGASTIANLESMLAEAGFVDISIEPKDDSDSFIREWDDSRDLSEYIVSARIEARKPE